jgi:hypothetical protein
MLRIVDFMSYMLRGVGCFHRNFAQRPLFGATLQLALWLLVADDKPYLVMAIRIMKERKASFGARSERQNHAKR